MHLQIKSNQILLMCHRYTQTHRQLMRVYETLNSEITKISMDGGESQGRESERGSVIQNRQISLPLAPLSKYQETD